MPFAEVSGHRRLLELLARSIERDSLPPSLIFAGPDGIGTRQTAIAVAQRFNCLAPGALRFADSSQFTVHSSQSASVDSAGGLSTVDCQLSTASVGSVADSLSTVNCQLSTSLVDACGRCPACTRIARGVHPDVPIVAPGDTGVIKIEQVRGIVDRAGYRPFEGKRRVVIIDEADALMTSAQNALLKTLEEPPPSSVFILATSRPDMLLATVRSRCIRLWFPAQTAAAVDVEVREVAERALAQAAAGGDPARLLDAAKALLGQTGGRGASDREQLSSHLRAMAVLVRDVAVLATRADDRALANPDVRPALERLTEAYRGERGVRAYTAIDQALAALERNAGVKVVADWVMLHL